MRAFSCLAIAGIAQCLFQVASAGVLNFDAAGAKNRPVSKVITLLKDMLKQLEKEAEEDEEIYDKMACWCETNDKEKTKSIADAEAHIADLETTIEEATALSARLSTEIKNLEKEVAKNQEALDKATAIRQKELAEFNAEEKDLLESISALKAAVTVLSKHHGAAAAMLQAPKAQLANVANQLKSALDKHRQLLIGAFSPAERRAIDAFLQAPGDYFDAQPTFKQSYAPQSGEIFGILKQMKETFEADLSEAQKTEMENQKAYEELKAAKEEEIAAGQAQLDTKSQELAATDEKLARAKEDIEDTKATLAADQQFLMMLKEKCSMTDKEWEERQKTRHLEMEAVSKALAVLSSDDAHDTFTKTFNPAAFIQKESSTQSEGRQQASAFLNTVAKKLGSSRLADLATRVGLDNFTRVKEAIDKMIAELLKEKQDEIKHKDFCVDEFNENQLQTERKEREKADVLAKIEDLKMTIEQLEKAIETLKSEIAEMQVQLKRAGEDREKENKVFQDTVADQRETQKLLQAALKVLDDFYGKKGSFLQAKQDPAGPAPPPGFGEYKKSEGAGGVMALLQQIISDAKAMEAETVRAEEDAQKAYEDFVKESNASIEAKSKDIVDKSEAKASAEQDLVEAESDKEAVLLELEQLSNYNAELHKSCDFILKNFDVRQSARDEEIEALRQAKAILSGAKFEEFLQVTNKA
jgi:DNA repair exonuclease SbcCD ATPase subunit